MIDLTDLLIAILSLFMAVMSVYVIPILKSKLSKNKWDEASRLVCTAVRAAEQLYKSGELVKDKRKEYVNQFLTDHNIKIRFEDIEALIEEYVSYLPHGSKDPAELSTTLEKEN